MRKILIPLILFISLKSLSVKSVENEFLGYHCLEALNQNVLIDSETDINEGEWIIDSEDYCSFNLLPQYEFFVNSPIIIKNNKVKFGGVITSLSNSKFNLEVPGTKKIIGKIKNDIIKLDIKIDKGFAKSLGSNKCKLEYKKNIQYNKKKQESLKACFYANITDKPYLKIKTDLCSYKSNGKSDYENLLSFKKNKCDKENFNQKEISYKSYLKINDINNILYFKQENLLFKGEKKIGIDEEKNIIEIANKANEEEYLYLTKLREKNKSRKIERKSWSKNNRQFTRTLNGNKLIIRNNSSIVINGSNSNRQLGNVSNDRLRRLGNGPYVENSKVLQKKIAECAKRETIESKNKCNKAVSNLRVALQIQATQNNQGNTIPTEEEQKKSVAQHVYQQNPGFNVQLYDPKLERILNSRGWSQIDPGLERQLNAIGRTQVPPKYQKRFAIRAGNMWYRF